MLESRLPEDLKGRVKYHYDVYRYAASECQAMSILVDGETWFCTDPRFWREVHYRDDHEVETNKVIYDTGHVGNSWGEAMKYVHQFLNVLSIDESISSDNYFIRMLAILDSRLGKRRIRKMAQYIDQEPEWFRKWIRLRLGESV